MSEIRCADCPLVKVPCRSEITRNNAHLERPRGYCFCTHVHARAAYQLRNQGPEKYSGFVPLKDGAYIGYTDGASDIPALKTTPVWCPRKMMYRPLRTSWNNLQKAIESKAPYGLMWAFNGQTGKFVAVDNRLGAVVVREFWTASLCKGWLNSLMAVESGGAQHGEAGARRRTVLDSDEPAT